MRLRSAFAIASSALALLLDACGEKPAPPPTALKLVRTLVVGASGQEQLNRYSGEVRARYESQLGFRVGGKIIERMADAGMRVKAGQPLARLDPADANLSALQADANRALAAADLKRSQDLKEKNFISQAALDTRETAAKAAEAQAALARNQSTYTTLVADAAGIVAAALAEPGQVIVAGQPVIRLARDGEREVAINIPEGSVAGLKVGAGATVTLWAAQRDEGGRGYKGVLRELSPAADAATRTFAARVRIADADDAVMLGMTATVSFAAATEPRLTVPLAAIIQQGNAPTVWVIGKDNMVTQRPIEVERYADAGAIVKSGLAGGERIVAAGAYKLTPGEKVRVAEQ